ncbi:MAG: hypothetical protein KOO60_07370 [Gemmatimonadales bacterium]|nr:hypothetical protein [Gemmatimonadales bacterium]
MAEEKWAWFPWYLHWAVAVLLTLAAIGIGIGVRQEYAAWSARLHEQISDRIEIEIALHEQNYHYEDGQSTTWLDPNGNPFERFNPITGPSLPSSRMAPDGRSGQPESTK